MHRHRNRGGINYLLSLMATANSCTQHAIGLVSCWPVLTVGCAWVLAFSSLARMLGECSTIHPPPVFFLFLCEVVISSRTLIPLFRPGSVHSGSAS